MIPFETIISENRHFYHRLSRGFSALSGSLTPPAKATIGGSRITGCDLIETVEQEKVRKSVSSKAKMLPYDLQENVIMDADVQGTSADYLLYSLSHTPATTTEIWRIT